MHDHRVIPFHPHHLRLMGSPHYLIDYANKIADAHPGWTAMCGDHPFASAGVIRPYPHLGEAWAVLGDMSPNHAIYFYRELSKRLPRVLDTLGLTRLQANVIAGHQAGLRLVRHLGFTHEATLRKYGPQQQDVELFALIKE